MNVRTYKTTGLALALLTILSFGFADIAYAGKSNADDKGSTRGHGRNDAGEAVSTSSGAATEATEAETTEAVQISEEQRTLISKFIASEYRDDCAGERKAADCAPDAQASSYSVGAELSKDVDTKGVSPKLRSALTAIPGHDYRQIGRDIVLIANDGKIVVDAVTLASAIGQ